MRDPIEHAQSGRRGGQYAAYKTSTKGGLSSAAKKREAASRPKEAPPAPLPPWLRGDKEGRAALPMKPPGKEVEK